MIEAVASCRLSIVTVAAAAIVFAHPGSAGAAGAPWQVVKALGTSWVTTTSGQRFVLAAGSSVEPAETIVTGDHARLVLARGTETMVVGPDSALAVSEQPTQGLSTTVIEKAGSVTFDVERRNVQHFSVETPMLAAVVKGTHFTVTVARANGQVVVSRGTVQVTAFKTGQMTDVTAGGRASVGSRGLSVSGAGQRATITTGPSRKSIVSSIGAVTRATVVSQGEQAAVSSVADSTTEAPATSGLIGALSSLISGSASTTATSSSATTSQTATTSAGTTSTSGSTTSGSTTSSSIGNRSTVVAAATPRSDGAAGVRSGSVPTGNGSSGNNGGIGGAASKKSDNGKGNAGTPGDGGAGKRGSKGGQGSEPSAGKGSPGSNGGGGSAASGKSDNGKGNSGTPGNGGAGKGGSKSGHGGETSAGKGPSGSNGEGGGAASGKSDNGKGNAGPPGNGGANKGGPNAGNGTDGKSKGRS